MRINIYSNAYPPNKGGVSNQVATITRHMEDVEVVLPKWHEAEENSRILKTEGILHPKNNLLFNGIERGEVFQATGVEWFAGPNVMPMRHHFKARKHWLNEKSARYNSQAIQRERDFIQLNYKGLISLNKFQTNFYTNLGADEDKIHVIPIAIDLKKFPLRKEPKQFRVGWVGYNGWVKGWQTVIEIALEMPDVEFELVSSNIIPIKEFYDKVPKNVSLFVALRHDIFAEHICSWSVNLNTSRVENSCVAIQECMARGIPIVCSDTQGNPESAKGQLIVEDVVEEYVRAIRKLQNSKKLRLEKGKAANKLITKRNDVRKIAKMYEELFK